MDHCDACADQFWSESGQKIKIQVQAVVASRFFSPTPRGLEQVWEVEKRINNNYCVRNIFRFSTFFLDNFGFFNIFLNIFQHIRSISDRITCISCFRPGWKWYIQNISTGYAPNTIIVVDCCFYPQAASAHQFWTESGVGNLTGPHRLP